MKAVNVRNGKRVPIHPVIRQAILDVLVPRFGCVCWYCGVKLGIKQIHLDHIDPLCKQGADTIDNLVLSCVSCNRAKWDLSLKDFFKWVERIRWLENYPAKPAFESRAIFCDRGDEVDKTDNVV